MPTAVEARYGPPELRRNLKRVYADAIAFSVMIGAGETYLPAFALALSMGEVTAGLIASVPMMAGAIIQLISPAAVRALGSNRKWVVLCATVQAASFIPLVIAAIVGKLPTFAIFLIASMYWGAGMATGPAWSTWAGTLIPRPIRAAYFARRSRAAHLAVLAGLLGGGISLHYGKQAGYALTAFALLFAAAGVCRFISAGLLASQSEPQPPDASHREVRWHELLKRFRHGHDGRLLVYLWIVQVAVQVSGPFFTPYMLGEIEMSYANYLLLIATAYSARIIFMPMLGEVVKRIGPHKLLWFSGLGLVPLSALWLASDSLLYLFFVQFVAGAVWAAYEFTTFLLLFETIPEHERTSVLTTYNFGNALAMVGGSALGAAMLHGMGSDHGAYMAIFALSGVLRLGTIPLLAFAAREIPKPTKPLEVVSVPTRIEAVRPNLGSIERPILPGLSSAASGGPAVKRHD